MLLTQQALACVVPWIYNLYNKAKNSSMLQMHRSQPASAFVKLITGVFDNLSSHARSTHFMPRDHRSIFHALDYLNSIKHFADSAMEHIRSYLYVTKEMTSPSIITYPRKGSCAAPWSRVRTVSRTSKSWACRTSA